MPAPRVVLSAFADEAANRKTALEQLSALAAVGLKHYSPRFVDVNGTGEVKHVVTLSKAEYQTLAKLHSEYGVRVTSIGSRIGKVKLKDLEDGSHNKFVPFKEYLKTEVASTIAAAQALDTRLIRGFSFYPPRGEDPQAYFPQAVDPIAHPEGMTLLQRDVLNICTWFTKRGVTCDPSELFGDLLSPGEQGEARRSDRADLHDWTPRPSEISEGEGS